MKEIKNVKLGINPKDMVVNVVADVEMNGKDDEDDLYLVMFNVMDSPLRLSLFTIGNLFDLVKSNSNLSNDEITHLMKNSPDKYIQYAVGNMDALGEVGVENIKIMLNSPENAKKARIVLSSMIDKKKYYQKTTYYIGSEEIQKEQEIDTEQLIPQFQQDMQSGIIKL